VTSFRRVMVIDDDMDFAGFVEVVLSAHGYEVVCAETAESAVEQLRAKPADLIIVDAMLSHSLGGWDVLKDIRALQGCQRIAVLLVSAVVHGDESELFPQGNGLWNRFMCKPISPQALVGAIAELLAERGDVDHG